MPPVPSSSMTRYGPSCAPGAKRLIGESIHANRLDVARYRGSNGDGIEVQNMPVSVKKISLWRAEVDNKPGALAALMQPLAAAGANLKVVMGYRHTAVKKGKAIVEI